MRLSETPLLMSILNAMNSSPVGLPSRQDKLRSLFSEVAKQFTESAGSRNHDR